MLGVSPWGVIYKKVKTFFGISSMLWLWWCPVVFVASVLGSRAEFLMTICFKLHFWGKFIPPFLGFYLSKPLYYFMSHYLSKQGPNEVP